MLAKLHGEVCAFKNRAGLSELPSAWKVASALERLLKQLADQAGIPAVPPLRTVACGLDLLDALCVPGLEASLAASPPFRVLVVDDDRVSRFAISQVVTRALNQPELAEDGATALALADKQTYDVIFLDVQMPGMNGFELCSRIHETDCNRTTPVMFVTCQSDFDARVQSVLVGGDDLVAKPFLAFDLTVKALSLALRRRILRPTPGASRAPAMA